MLFFGTLPLGLLRFDHRLILAKLSLGAYSLHLLFLRVGVWRVVYILTWALAMVGFIVVRLVVLGIRALSPVIALASAVLLGVASLSMALVGLSWVLGLGDLGVVVVFNVVFIIVVLMVVVCFFVAISLVRPLIAIVVASRLAATTIVLAVAIMRTIH